LKEDERVSLLSVLEGSRAAPPPIWLMRQAGRYLPEYRAMREKAGSFWAMCMNPQSAAEITLQPIRRFGFDAAILFSDILVVPYALGCDVAFEDGPVLTPVSDAARLDGDPGRWKTRLAPVYDTIRLVRSSLSKGVSLLGFAGAAWTLATYMAEGKGSSDQRAAKLWDYRDPKGFQALLDVLEDCVAFHLAAQLEAGADAVQIFDSWAGGLPARQFADWVIAPTKRIVDKVRAVHPGAKIIGFPRAATLEGYRRYAVETGVDAVSLDTAVPMEWAARELPRGVVLQGNLDPIALVAGGRALADATDAILGAMHSRPFIFNLGHGVLPETPPEHVAELVARVRQTR
jgi:uroporphyrinogen decarboxylase